MLRRSSSPSLSCGGCHSPGPGTPRRQGDAGEAIAVRLLRAAAHLPRRGRVAAGAEIVPLLWPGGVHEGTEPRAAFPGCRRRRRRRAHLLVGHAVIPIHQWRELIGYADAILDRTARVATSPTHDGRVPASCEENLSSNAMVGPQANVGHP